MVVQGDKEIDFDRMRTAVGSKSAILAVVRSGQIVEMKVDFSDLI